MKRLPIRTFADDLADAIANPSPSRPLRDAVGRQGRKVCDALSNVPPWARTIPGYTRDLFGICAPYWDDNGYDPPVVTPPLIPGGQCEGVSYSVGSLGTDVCPTSRGNTIIRRTGPGPVSVAVGATIDTGQFPRPLQTTFLITFANGTQTMPVRHNVGLIPCVRAFRIDDQPDTCGDAPTQIEPGPNPAPNPGPLPPDEEPIDDPIRGPLLPIPDIPGLPGLPDIPWRNPFPNPGGDGLGGEPGEPGEPVETDGGDGVAPATDAEGEAPAGSELVSLKLTLVSALPRAKQYGDGIYRAAAYIRMGTPDGLDQDFGGSQVESGQMFFAETNGLTKWRVTANIGLKWNVTPYYREVN